ncbi:MAG: Major facilitator permease [Chloroflexi bacterium]|nr:Major facilitator permease [Chloroflexota bacterium]
MAAAATSATEPLPALDRRTIPVIVSLMLTLFLTALDTTIVNTALPSISGSLGNFALYAWVPSIYLLTTAVSTPIWGKLADLYGRRPVLYAGMGIFLLGSVLSGAAPSMLFLVITRAVQGLGAGAVQPVTTTIVGDMFEPKQRARVQGLFSSVWGVAALLGPLSGGLLSDNLSWRWIFYVNVPIVILAFVLLQLFFVERGVHRDHRLDYRGASLMTLTLTALLLLVLNGETVWPWLSVQSALLAVLAAGGAVLLVREERRAAEPVLPLKLFRMRVVAVSTVVGFCIGMIRIGISFQVPLFVQGVLSKDAVQAGLALAPMSIGWPLAGSFSGKLSLRYGYRTIALVGMACCALGVCLLLTLGANSSFLTVSAFAFVVGIGLGLSATPVLVALQSAVEWKQRGVATGSQMFMRNFGSVVGLALVGLSLNHALAGKATSRTISQVLSVHGRSGLSQPARNAIQLALLTGMHTAFVVVLISAVGGFVALLSFPRQQDAPAKAAVKPEAQPAPSTQAPDAVAAPQR